MTKLKGTQKTAFLVRMAKGRAAKLRKSVKRVTKSAKTKRKTVVRKSTVAKRKSSGRKKSGTTMQTRLKKFAIGAGIGVGLGVLANIVKQPALAQLAPVVDAFAGAGIEGQLGTVAVRVVPQLLAGRGIGAGGTSTSSFFGGA